MTGKVIIDRLSYIKKLLEEGKIEKAKEKCKMCFPNPKFICLYIKILIMEGNYEEAEKLSKENLNNEPILSQYVTFLLRQGRHSEAREICEKKRNIEHIYPQYINVLGHYNEFNKIEKIVKRFPYNRNINRSYSLVLFRKKRYNDALYICDRFIYDKEMKKFRDILVDAIKNNDNLDSTEFELMDEEIYSPRKETIKDEFDGYKTKAERKKLRRKYQLEEKSDNEKFFVYSRVQECIDNGNYAEGKSICKRYLDDKNVFDLYIYILEKERVKKLRKNI